MTRICQNVISLSLCGWFVAVVCSLKEVFWETSWLACRREISLNPESRQSECFALCLFEWCFSFSRFLFDQPIFPELFQIRPVPKSKLFEFLWQNKILHAGCPFCRQTNSVKALKDENWWRLFGRGNLWLCEGYHIRTVYACFPRTREGFSLQAFLSMTCYLNFCSACAVTVVIFGHKSFSFYLLKSLSK